VTSPYTYGHSLSAWGAGGFAAGTPSREGMGIL
jgi:hypothetical protein